MTPSSTPAPDAPRSPAHLSPLRRLTARDRGEVHRSATQLELFFDLCFVVAIAQAGIELVHAVAEGHAGEGILYYALVFFAIWWAWMNFTWFASAYDNDDVLFRVVTLIQIAGVLVLAAGVSRAFEDHEYRAGVAGYVIMRLASVSQWLRVARSSQGRERRVALRYAGGVVLCQIGWVGLVVLPEDTLVAVFVVMAVLEMCVPAYAEKVQPTSWHPRHIAERYGLFTIIVLGETIAAATVAVKTGIDEQDALGELLPIAAGGLLIIFAAWWIYFVVPIHGHLRSNRQAFLWGYGHYVVFASAAAIGAGLEVAVEQSVGKAHISTLSASAAVTLPTALYLFTVWALHARHFKVGIAQQLVLPTAALLVSCCMFLGEWAVLSAGLVCALTVVTGETLTARTTGRERETAVGAPFA
ncbi:low temperature requirement protein A [Streptomyces acidiscabies]|uniref:Low temperature requirement protein A n=1 Tax=Streptomyces acidiscabies TaxID=42234 RepID=A0AAP6EKQ4_9ACTN|nr:low temperature requirement protein A [Streptomyces acidiscabies]MBP5942133.1 low temperature requirement protein A [Streptomyces sp. LBUM 1476]MBZ3913646.1 low temperature requirement protein A [Streptomyces acidiscabies]MDX2966512.1 low temperature requirement protein A [Streptomyces acidiscabies]MDX3025883.1 low temperature requirement protein A [Streptomyces acidiscabies]MDX3796465.1 low temperature requirement protein A [Streptomyces acidiscabies]